MQTDVLFAQAVRDTIADYLDSQVLFYPLNAVGGVELPQLTIGAWLETDWRARGMQFASGEQAMIDAARAAVAEARAKSRDTYISKAQREFKSRLDTWSWYLDEPRGGKTAYASQAHTRLKLELLQSDVAQSKSEQMRLKTNDARLRTMWVDGDFIWEPPLIALAPRDTHWWLYGGLK